MKKNYQQLNQFDRDRIEVLLLAGHKQKEIANVLGRDPTTIGREIKRNRRKLRKLGGHKDGPYIASVANHKAYVRRKYAKYQGMKIITNRELEDYIIDKLKLHWSPDEISGRMKQEGQPFYASKDLIYAWIYSVWGQKYAKYLYSKRSIKRKRKSKKSLKVVIPNRIGIEFRPIKANQRKTFGHYEIDTLVSGKTSHSKESLAVVYERKARYIDVRKIKSLSPKQLNIGVNKMFNNLKQKETATLDNGFENREHQKLNIQTYFCDPYSSWQKGGVENANKMIRRYIPKGSDISNYTHQYITIIIQRINKKPRKSLGYKTPLEVMLENNLLINPKRQKVALGG
jgi:IS30 family transposase